MAQKRMFSKSITSSSRFLMMPQSSQNLYFHLGMNADDDGFCEHFAIMRMTDSKPDDLKVLQSKGFVKVFDDKVLIVLDWKENNRIRSDRYTPSKYLAIYKKEVDLLSKNECSDDISNGMTVGIPNANQMADIGYTEVRLGKVRIGKDNTATNVALSPFVLEEYLKKMSTDSQPHIKFLAFYIKKKGLTPKSAKEVGNIIGRFGKTAVKITETYSKSQISKAIDLCIEKHSDIDWGVETIYKKLTNNNL